MSGYVPLFDTIATGTLYGRWPDIGVWPIVLALADKHGILDVTPHYLSGVLGLPVEQVAACMKRFCAPDLYSRTKDEDGARLRLLDDHRDWGWQIVNHGKYREKARKQMQQIDATASGRDAERKRQERLSSDVRRSPVEAGSQTQTQTHTQTKTQSKNPTAHSAPCDEPEFVDFKLVYPSRAGDQGWRRAHRAVRARLSDGYSWNEILEGTKRYAAFIAASGKEGTEYVKQAATFLGPDLHFLEPWTLPKTKSEVVRDQNINTSLEWLHATS